MKIFEFAVKRPVAVTMIMLVVILLGSVSFSKLGLDLFPKMDLPMLLVQTSYSGAGPEEMENQVTRVLEGAIGTVNGIKNITSTSSRGSSLVMAEFAWGTDLNFATNQIRDRLDIYGQMLPQDADKPMIIKMDPTMIPIIQILVSGQVELTELTQVTEDVIRPAIERVNGIATVAMSGGLEEEIRITAAPQRLQAYGVSINQVLGVLMAENSNVSAGTIEEGLRDHSIRIIGEFDSIEDIEDLQIATGTGGQIRLAELATVQRVGKDRDSYVFSNGQPGINLSLMQQSDANMVKVSDAVRAAISDISKQLPEGYEVTVAFDQADYIRLSLSNVARSAVLGGILAILILFVFLRNFRSTLIIAFSIPISIIATFAMMYFTDVSLNMISLGGLALGLGMIVDNSIVVLENTYRFRQEGHQPVDAAISAVKEVAGAIIASTMTTIVVFVPIVFVEGLAAQIFRPMALTIACSLIASLVVALLLVPMLSARLLQVKIPTAEGSGRKGFGDIVGGYLDKLNFGYRRLFKIAIKHKGFVVAVSFVLFIGSLLLIPKVGMEFIPAQDTGEYSVTVSLPNGVALSETMRVAQQVEQVLQSMPENQRLTYTVGGGGNNMFGGSGGSQTATFTGILVTQDQRERSMDEVLDEIRLKLQPIPGATISVANSGAMVMMGAALSVNIKGDDLKQLGLIAEAVKERIEQVEGTREVKTSTEDGGPEVHVVVDRQRAAQYGLSSSTVSSAVAAAVNGRTATKLRSEGQEIDIRVILDKQYRENLNDLAALTIASPTGAVIPLEELASLNVSVGPTAITRENQSRMISVTSEVVNRDLASVVADIQSEIAKMNIPSDVMVEYGGSNKEMVEAFKDLFLALILAILLVYIVMAFQFEQLLYPLVIMFAIPPTVVGVIISLLLTGRTISVPTFIGIIMLVGIVVNNAIVLVDYINVLRRDYGMSREDAILQAGPTRLRPILMTTLTTVLGMLPVAIGIGEGAELMAPMGTALAGGLAFSTLVTLFLVPCMYLYLENLSDAFKRLLRRISGRKEVVISHE